MIRCAIPVLLLPLLLQPAFADQEVDERVPMRADGTLEVSVLSGSVEVVGWDRDEVHVSGELGKPAERLEVEADGRSVRIKVIMAKRHSHDYDDAADLTIRAPSKGRLTVTTVSADITSERMDASQRLHSVSGDIVTSIGQAEDVEIQTVSGDVEIDGKHHPGRLTVTLVSGDAEIDDISGEISVQTVSGSANVRGRDFTRIKLKSTSGDIDLHGNFVAGRSAEAQLDAQSISGDILLQLCGEVDAQFELSSFSGDIDGFFGQRSKRTSEFGPGRELRFTRGSGAGRIHVNTMSGDIEHSGC